MCNCTREDKAEISRYKDVDGSWMCKLKSQLRHVIGSDFKVNIVNEKGDGLGVISAYAEADSHKERLHVEVRIPVRNKINGSCYILSTNT